MQTTSAPRSIPPGTGGTWGWWVQIARFSIILPSHNAPQTQRRGTALWPKTELNTQCSTSFECIPMPCLCPIPPGSKWLPHRPHCPGPCLKGGAAGCTGGSRRHAKVSRPAAGRRQAPPALQRYSPNSPTARTNRQQCRNQANVPSSCMANGMPSSSTTHFLAASTLPATER